MSPRLHVPVLAVAAGWWRRQWHNVAIAAVLVPLLAVAWWIADTGWGWA